MDKRENMQLFVVEEESNGKRLDVFLSEVSDITRSQVKKLIQKGAVTINGKNITKASVIVSVLDSVEIKDVVEEDKLPEKVEVLSLDIPVKILSETDDYVVVYKPAGYLVHPTQAKEYNTLTDWLVNKYKDIVNVGDSRERPGIVHRLDKDASGVLVVAKTQAMFECLKKQFQERLVEKEYAVIVHGALDREHGIIDFDIDRGTDGRMVSRPKIDKLSVDKVDDIQSGKKSLTEFWVEKTFVNYSLLRVKIYTGRTHQIRVHMFAYAHPVVGDRLYINRKVLHARDLELGRLWLHARKLGFVDLKGNPVSFEAAIPENLLDFASSLV